MVFVQMENANPFIVQGEPKVWDSFVENGIFLIYAILLYRWMLFIAKLYIKNFI